MDPEQLAHEFMLGFREAMSCPDVALSEYEAVMAHKIRQAMAASEAMVAELTAKVKQLQEENATLSYMLPKDHWRI